LSVGAILAENVEVDLLLGALSSAATPSAVALGKTLWGELSIAAEVVVILGREAIR
jgi:hypothetical protein